MVLNYLGAPILKWFARELLRLASIAKSKAIAVLVWLLVGALRHAVATVLLFAALTHFTLILK